MHVYHNVPHDQILWTICTAKYYFLVDTLKSYRQYHESDRSISMGRFADTAHFARLNKAIVAIMAENNIIRTGVKYIKLGDFEVEFPDTIDLKTESGRLGLQLHDFVLKRAVKFLEEQYPCIASIVRIQAGLKHFLACDTSDPSLFSFFEDRHRPCETKWKLIPGSVKETFAIESTTFSRHWKYEAENNFIILEENYPNYENCPKNLFYIDHNTKIASPYDAPNMKAIGFIDIGQPPPHYQSLRIPVVDTQNTNGADLELHLQ